MKGVLIFIIILSMAYFLSSCFNPDFDIPDFPEYQDTNVFRFDNYGLAPDTISVKKDTYLEIYNFSSSVHNVIISGDTNYQTGDMVQYDSYLFYLKYPGKYNVKCTLHDESALLLVNQ